MKERPMAAKTMFEKIWESHVVRTEPDGTVLLYVDRHLVHEVTSPQAFEDYNSLAARHGVPKPRLPSLTITYLLRIATNLLPTLSARNKWRRYEKTVRRLACLF